MLIARYMTNRVLCIANQVSCLSQPVSSTRSGVLDLLTKVQSNGCLYQSRLFSLTCDKAIKKQESSGPDKKLIYYGKLGTRIKGLKAFSFGSSATGILTQAYIYDGVMSMNLPTPLMVVLYTFIGIFTFVTPFLIHLVTRKYILEITHNPVDNTYESKTMTFFFGEKVVNFTLDDIKENDNPSVFNTYFIKNKPVIIFTEGFLDRDHYIKIQRYDQPINLHLSENKSDSDKL